LIHYRKNYFRICKYRFLLFLSHLFLLWLWQKLFFSWRLEIFFFWLIFINFSDEIIEIYFSRNTTHSRDIISFVAIVTNKNVYLIEFESLTYFRIIRFLIWFKCLKSKSHIRNIWLFARWLLIIHVFSQDRFFIIIFMIFFYISKLDIHIAKNLIDELT
jgi:hypothetical protein